jgi:hypothetical protein
VPRQPKSVAVEKLAKWDPVRVMWEDALHDHGTHNATKFIAEYKATIRQSIGWFLGTSEGHKQIFVAMSADNHGKGLDDEDCQTIDVIPIDMVIHITRLSRAEAVKVPGR